MSGSDSIKTSKAILGRLGEDAVANLYAQDGFTIVARNLHVSHNEIDLILQNSTHLVFVEVKARHAVPHRPGRYGRPAAAVNAEKRRYILTAVKTYLREHPTDLQPRIDIAEVYLKKYADGTEEVEQILRFPRAIHGNRR